MVNKKEELVMKFDPKTIEHLGVRMYTQVPSALAELIANSYDACAKKVYIKLYDTPDIEIVVEDNGTGMTFNEINSLFLIIGRNRREEGDTKTPCGRKPTGRKGLGKLAFFGISDGIEITTMKKAEKTTFTLDWDDLMGTESGKPYKPNFKLEKCHKKTTGTIITLRKLKRKTVFNLEEVAYSLSRYFNFYDKDFDVYISLNNGKEIKIDNKLKYSRIVPQFKWEFPGTSIDFDKKFKYARKIVGKLFSPEKPLQPGYRGITIFSNGRLVNKPEFFGISESGHFYSYLTGFLDLDFIDDWQEDVISTNRQSLNWDNEELLELRRFLQKILASIENDWRHKRRKKRRAQLSEKVKIDIEKWFDTIPEHAAKKIEPIVKKLMDDEELETEARTKIVEDVHALFPEYAEYHWRLLHKAIQKVTKEDYMKKDYLRAAKEGTVKYENEVKRKSDSNQHGVDLMNQVFGSISRLEKKMNEEDKKKRNAKARAQGKINRRILITNDKTETEQNIEEGQKNLSKGLIEGFRNPTHHETKDDIYPDLFGDKDCLDILSLISYLMHKLDKSKKINA